MQMRSELITIQQYNLTVAFIDYEWNFATWMPESSESRLIF